jgi:hypothetical protein
MYLFMAVPPVSNGPISHSPRSQHDRTRQEDRHHKFYALRDNLHYADAIPLELLKSEQDRITTAIAGAEGRLAAIAADFRAAETNLQRALTRAGDCQAAYAKRQSECADSSTWRSSSGSSSVTTAPSPGSWLWSSPV